jgi:sodium/proline symporter
MLSGGIMVFVWKEGISKLGGAFGVYELLPSFLLSSMVIFLVSLATPKPSGEIEREFEAAKTAEF